MLIESKGIPLGVLTKVASFSGSQLRQKEMSAKASFNDLVAKSDALRREAEELQKEAAEIEKKEARFVFKLAKQTVPPLLTYVGDQNLPGKEQLARARAIVRT